MPDDKRITHLTQLLAPAGADVFAIMDVSEPNVDDQTKKITVATLDARYLLYDAGLASIAGLVTAADKMIYTTALDTYAVADLSAFARTLLDDANAAAAKVTLSLGSMADIDDAPSDGSQYARQDAAWAVVSGGVTSVFGRTGAVVAVAGDYTASLITNVAAGNIAAVTVQAAIDELDTDKAGLALANVFTAAQMVDGSADAIQMRIQAVAGQTANIQTWEDSAGNILGYVDKRGIPSWDANVAANYCTFIGELAGNISQTGDSNTGIGYKALSSLTSGADNLAIGFQAGWKLTTGVKNMIIGTNAARVATTAYSNVAIGYQALFGLTTGIGNIALGTTTLTACQTGIGNIAIGLDAGKTNTGSYSVFIGYQTGKDETGGYRLYIASSDTTTPLIYGEFDTGLLKFHTVDAGTATAPNTVSLVHLSSGTPLANFGVSLRFGLESSLTENQDAARLAGLWNDPVDAQRAADLVAYASDFNAEREIWRGRADGTNPMFAVLGQTPAARQAHIADPAGGGTQDAEARTAINSILAALETFGYLATS